MNDLAVGLLTLLPVLIGAKLGYRRGGERTLVWLTRVIVAWGTGIGLTLYGLRLGCHWPAGLISPIVIGLLGALMMSRLLVWRDSYSVTQERIGVFQRTVGTTLGAVIGFVLAVAGWQVALLADSLTTPLQLAANEGATLPHPQVSQQSAWSSLAEVAHQGFLKHLPVAGPLSDEMLAVGTILKTPQAVRRQYALHKGWDSLAALPSLQAIANDQALFAEIDAAVSGNLASLYRLQKHPLIMEFYHEEPLQAMISNLQASQIADELLDFQSKTDEPAY